MDKRVYCPMPTTLKSASKLKVKNINYFWILLGTPARDGEQRVQLRTEDCYLSDGSPRDYINFRARTRKASPDGQRQTRICVCSCGFEGVVAKLQGRVKLGLDVLRSHTRQTHNPTLGIMILRAAVEKAGLTAKGISTHSTRRSFITKLHRNGTDLYTIKKITGHKDFKALERYVEIDSKQVKGAIAAL